MALDDLASGADSVDFESGAFVELKSMVHRSLKGKTPEEIASFYAEYQQRGVKHGMMIVAAYVKNQSFLFRSKFYRCLASASKPSNGNGRKEPYYDEPVGI